MYAYVLLHALKLVIASGGNSSSSMHVPVGFFHPPTQFDRSKV